jgi:uncharacterized protein YjfI (DUF2170 family)
MFQVTEVTKEEVARAKAVLRNAGYYVVPREKVLVIGANESIQHIDMVKYGDNPSFIETVMRKMHAAMGVEMMKAKICSLQIDDDPAHFGHTYRLRATMLPYNMVTDPLLEFLREGQG